MLSRIFKLKKARRDAFEGRWAEVLLLLDEMDLSDAEQSEFLRMALLQAQQAVAISIFQNPKQKGEFDWDIMQCAILNNCAEFLEVVISSGHDVHRPFSDGTTLLEVSAFKGHLECLDVVIRHGGDASDWSSTVFRNLTDDVLVRLKKLGVEVASHD
jgi:hypothetical protein